ncbi:LLM class flavin-dependent oxidoreductase [Gulosibacter sediminis]|uniref:LLM class flavin-dependent oxidoreductase n=1 Tax=Gulosibacter sediminis TaxID=1729695 RepID=UPI0024ACCEF7|nr:LLM class flavin-dependent oxidoreductase [Gulosibacter sediminis]
MTSKFSIGLAAKGAGWHAGADAVGGFAPQDPAAWAKLAQRADEAGIDVLTIEDSLAPLGTSASFDSFILTNWLAPQTTRIGLVPAATTSLLEPFHTATAVATLDYTSEGRAAVRLRTGGFADESAAVGREDTLGNIREARALPPQEFERLIADRFNEGVEFAEVVRLLWDSWEDDAEIRDLATSRFIDRERIHNPEFTGEHFSVFGASITPRPPQGQPPVFSLAHTHTPYRFAAVTADVVLITPETEGTLEEILASLAEGASAVDRQGSPLKVWVDYNILIADDAAARLAELEAAGGELASDAALIAGTADEVAARILELRDAGIDGIRVRPLVTDRDTEAFISEVLPKLRDAGVEPAEGANLRERLGLAPAANRFVTTPPFTANAAAVTASTQEVSA